MLKMIDRFIARIRVALWKPQEFPCGICGCLLDRKIAHHTGDGWLVAWECPNYCGWEEAFIMEWPFVREYVWASDWQSIGIEVV